MLGLFAGILLAAGASVAPVSFETRTVSFESAGEPAHVMVSRLGAELDLRLEVAPELAEERLVIYAPEVFASELLEYVAWTLYSEWLPVDGGGFRLNLKQGEATSLATPSINAPKSYVSLRKELTAFQRPLSQSRSHEVAAELHQIARDYSRLNDSPPHIMAETPIARFVARLLAPVPIAELERLDRGTRWTETPLVITSLDSSPRELDFSTEGPLLLEQLSSDYETWMQMLERHDIASIRRVFMSIRSPSDRDWRGLSEPDVSLHDPQHFAVILYPLIRDDTSVARARTYMPPPGHYTDNIQIFWLDQDGRAIGLSTLSNNTLDLQRAWEPDRWADDTVEQEKVNLWVQPGQFIVPLPSVQEVTDTYVRDPSILDEVEKGQLEAIRILSGVTNKAIIMRAMPSTMLSMSQSSALDLVHLARYFQLSLASDSDANKKLFRMDEHWLGARDAMFDGGVNNLRQSALSLHDHGALLERRRERGFVKLSELLDLARVSVDAQEFDKVLGVLLPLYWQDEEYMYWVYGNIDFWTLSLLAEFEKEDRLWNTPFMLRRVDSLSERAQQALETWVYSEPLLESDKFTNFYQIQWDQNWMTTRVLPYGVPGTSFLKVRSSQENAIIRLLQDDSYRPSGVVSEFQYVQNAMPRNPWPDRRPEMFSISTSQVLELSILLQGVELKREVVLHRYPRKSMTFEEFPGSVRFRVQEELARRR